jgi:uncharacterized phage protein gp47/JayE
VAVKAPIIDDRGAKEIYEEAQELAREYYCGEWDSTDSDAGVVILRLFSKLAETVIRQVNRIPEKHILSFYDFVGIDHKPPESATVPLTFGLAKGTEGMVVIPKGTKVASEKDDTVVFSTLSTLASFNFDLKSVYSLNTWEDKYTKHGTSFDKEKGDYTFGCDDKEDSIEHSLYLADPAFDFKTAGDVTLKFSYRAKGAIDPEELKEYFSHSCDGEGKTISAAVNVVSDNRMDVTFTGVSIPESSVNDTKNNWISFNPKGKISPANKKGLPVITKITCDVNIEGIGPDAVLFNDTLYDGKKGFYPFGEMPKRGDALYIGCDEAFSKKGATISINLDLDGGTASNDLDLAWEYWNGKNWTPFGDGALTDSTCFFKKSGALEATIVNFPQVKATELGGNEVRWIRVRIDKGDYGKPAGYSKVKSIEDIIKSVLTAALLKQVKTKLENEGITHGYDYTPPSFAPPYVKSITLGYKYENRKVRYAKTYNNFKFQDVGPRKSFSPFVLLGEMPSFYLGLDGLRKNNTCTLYFSFKGKTAEREDKRIEAPRYSGEYKFSEKARKVAWEYYDGTSWKEIGAEDGTEMLTKNGIISFIVPADLKKKKEFEEDLFWIRATLKEGKWFEPPVLRGIFTNAVLAENAVLVKNELLGTSNGEADQVFNFSMSPLMEGQVIEVKEPGHPTGDEMEMLGIEHGEDAVRLLKNDSGDIEEVWIRWQEVNSFVHSTAKSRHYVIDRVNGSVIFSNGSNGMIPPPLPNNIKAASYKSGGGSKGNQKELTLTGLKASIPGIESVTNPDTSTGGRDLEKLKDVLERSPYTIKTRERAVTREDFERLAIDSSPSVSKSKTYMKEDHSTITTLIAPDVEYGSLYPDAALLDHVETYLKERAFMELEDRIEVLGPTYTQVNVSARIVPKKIEEGPLVAENLQRKIKEFLHPLKGGKDREGWEFGQDIFLSEIATLIEEEEGLDYADEVKISTETAKPISDVLKINNFVEIDENSIPCQGEILVETTGGT